MDLQDWEEEVVVDQKNQNQVEEVVDLQDWEAAVVVDQKNQSQMEEEVEGELVNQNLVQQTWEEVVEVCMQLVEEQTMEVYREVQVLEEVVVSMEKLEPRMDYW